MPYLLHHKLTNIVVISLLLIGLLVIVEVLIIKYNGSPVPAPIIPREARVIGQGPPLIYAVLGDSTAVGQGGAYEQGIALATARFLADQRYRVTMRNFAVSGARVKDVRDQQISQARTIRPDIVLLSVGANDVTHLTNLGSLAKDMQASIDALRGTNPNVRIVLTGAPQMGAVPRFPEPITYYAKVRTARVNTTLAAIAKEKRIAFAALADRTGPIFMRHPELFARDKFHPNDAGYEVWKPVLAEALADSLR